MGAELLEPGARSRVSEHPPHVKAMRAIPRYGGFDGELQMEVSPLHLRIVRRAVAAAQPICVVDDQAALCQLGEQLGTHRADERCIPAL